MTTMGDQGVMVRVMAWTTAWTAALVWVTVLLFLAAPVAAGLRWWFQLWRLW